MIKKMFVLATILISTLGCAQKEETSFKKESLEYVLKTTEDKPIAFQEIVKNMREKQYLLKFGLLGVQIASKHYLK